jgi:hypothetical protein
MHMNKLYLYKDIKKNTEQTLFRIETCIYMILNSHFNFIKACKHNLSKEYQAKYVSKQYFWVTLCGP